MIKERILEIAKANDEWCGGHRIKHPKNPDTVYAPVAVVQMHCDDGEWREGIVYEDMKTEKTYARRADDFAKFEEVV